MQSYNCVCVCVCVVGGVLYNDCTIGRLVRAETLITFMSLMVRGNKIGDEFQVMEF